MTITRKVSSRNVPNTTWACLLYYNFITAFSDHAQRSNKELKIKYYDIIRSL